MSPPTRSPRRAVSPPSPGLVVLVRTPGPALSRQARGLVARVAAELSSQRALGRVLSVLDAPQPSALVSRDGRATLVLGYFGAHASERAATAAARRVARDLRSVRGVTVGGDQLTFSQLEDTISAQLPKVELIAFSILLLLSLLAFRGLVAAALPLMVGAVAVAGSLLILRALTHVTSLSVYSLNLVTGLGLGLAIDYSLFVVYRYREELARCGHCSQALERTLATAGRTVAFSSLTVSVALLSLLVFPQPMLSSMGIAAAVVTLFAASAALIPLAAMLALLGPRVNALSPARLQRARRHAEGPALHGRWYRLATRVMRRPGWVAAACAVCLLLVGLPALHLHLGSTDARVLPPGSSARTVQAAVAGQFAADPANPVLALVHAPGDAGPALQRYRAQLARLPGAAAVEPPSRIAAGLWTVAVLAAASAAEHTVAAADRRDLRAARPLSGRPVGRGGEPVRRAPEPALAHVAGARDPGRDHADRAVPDDGLGRARDQVAGHEPADAQRRVRAAGADLPGRPAAEPARLHRHRLARADEHDHPVHHRLRALDRLRRVPLGAHQGGARRGRG